MKMTRFLPYVEVEVHPVTSHEGPEGEYKFTSTLSLILTLDGVHG